MLFRFEIIAIFETDDPPTPDYPEKAEQVFSVIAVDLSRALESFTSTYWNFSREVISVTKKEEIYSVC